MQISLIDLPVITAFLPFNYAFVLLLLKLISKLTGSSYIYSAI
jgi:hypothetical protein